VLQGVGKGAEAVTVKAGAAADVGGRSSQQVRADVSVRATASSRRAVKTAHRQRQQQQQQQQLRVTTTADLQRRSAEPSGQQSVQSTLEILLLLFF